MTRIDKIKSKINVSCMKGANSVRDFARKEVADKKNSLSVKLFYSLWSVMTAITAVVGTMSMAFAEEQDIGGAVDSISGAFKDMFSSIYGGILTVASVAAAAIIAICLLIRMFSKNPKSAESATEWMKRVIISYAILLMMGLIFIIIRAVAKSSGANTSTPWVEN